ncbi:MAG: glucose 1-dehydrogenase [Caulobacteraceae bacterium]|nr:glucose 1-dehydrogenase [Caulobacteraceae bacterium]
MDYGLKGKVAIVTGASRGIGRAICEQLADEGCKLMVSARGEAGVAETVDALKAKGAEVVGLPTDVADPESLKTLVAKTVEAFGEIHILVNNAGGQRRHGGFEDLEDADYIQCYEDNVLSVVRLFRAALPHLRKHREGRVINICSEVATQPERIFPHYNAAKAAQLNLTKSMSKAYARDGILVNAVSPGLIKTSSVENGFLKDAERLKVTPEEAEAAYMKRYKPGLVLGRSGKPEEVAAIVTFLASAGASFITGSNYRVDGGSVVTL